MNDKNNMIIGNRTRKDILERKDEIITLYANGHSSRNMGKIFNCSKWLIINILKKNGIKIKKLTDYSHRKYLVNDNYFSIPNIENCYWAGFIAADGNIRDNNILRLHINKKDQEHLLKFTEDIECNNKILKTSRLVGVDIHSKKICSDLLINFNITPRKSLTLQSPNIFDEELIKAYIRGYIDGDGSIGMSNKTFFMNIAGTESVLSWILKIFKIINPELKTTIRKRNNIFTLDATSGRIFKIYNNLKELKTPQLMRKWIL